MKKLYYDCPLEAAYMAKNFGVEIYTIWKRKDGDRKQTHDKEKLRDLDCYATPYYIEDDSLHIFEPQVGDLVEYRTNGSIAYVETNFTIVFKRKILMRDDMSDYDYEGFGFNEIPLTGDEKIIQRNNKAFIMPKNATS